MGELVPIIVILVFIGIGILRKLMEYASRQAGEEGGPAEDYETPPDEVRRFLEEIRSARQPMAPVPAAQAEPRAPTPMEQLFGSFARAQEPGEPVVIELEPALEAVQVEEPPAQAPRMGAPEQPRAAIVPVPTPRKPRRKPARRKKRPSRKPVTARREPEPAKPEAKKPADIKALKTGRLTLRQAVIWSEILGTPVGLRRYKGHRPPTVPR